MSEKEARGAMSIHLRQGEYIEIGDGIEIYIAAKNKTASVRLVVVAPKRIRVERRIDPDSPYARKERTHR